MLGYKLEEIIGKTPFDLMPTDEAMRIAEIFKDKSEKRDPIVALENINVHKEDQKEKEQHFQEFKKVLENVKALSGLLPICVFCKKNRKV
jgi:PAS domain S-box-containing protein